MPASKTTSKKPASKKPATKTTRKYDPKDPLVALMLASEGVTLTKKAKRR